MRYLTISQTSINYIRNNLISGCIFYMNKNYALNKVVFIIKIQKICIEYLHKVKKVL